MAVMKCPTCGRRPSERRGYEYYNPCTDELHDIADDVQEITATAARFEAERDALKARVEELEGAAKNREALYQASVRSVVAVADNWDAARADLAEAVAWLRQCRKDVGAHLHTETCPTCSLWTDSVDAFLLKHQPSVEGGE